MPNCKICGREVVAGPVLHSECLTKLVTEAAEEFCDNYCRWTLTNADQLEAHCDRCPMEQMMKLLEIEP